MSSCSFFVAILILTFVACKKDPNLSNDPGNGLTMLKDSLIQPPGWTCLKDSDQYVFSFSNTNAVILDVTGMVWVAGGQRLRKFQNNILINYPQAASMLIDNSDIAAIVEDQNNTLWMGCNITRFSGGNTKPGIIKYDGINFIQYTESNSGLNNGLIYAVGVDSLNNKWFGTENSLVKFDETSWSFYDSTNSPLKEFHPINISNNIIWIGGHNSLTKFDGSTWQEFNQSNSSFPNSGIRVLEHDNFNNLWFFGFNSSVLWKFDGVDFTSYPIPVQLPIADSYSEEYHSIGFDNQNNLWIGGYGKLVRYDGMNWTNFSAPIYIPGGDPRFPIVGRHLPTTIYDIVIKNDNSIWVASSIFPLMKFKE